MSKLLIKNPSKTWYCVVILSTWAGAAGLITWSNGLWSIHACPPSSPLWRFAILLRYVLPAVDWRRLNGLVKSSVSSSQSLVMKQQCNIMMLQKQILMVHILLYTCILNLSPQKPTSEASFSIAAVAAA